jgi:hypothetical protein
VEPDRLKSEARKRSKMPPTPEELAAAWRRVNTAHEALRAYVEREDREPNPVLHVCLAEELRQANVAYLNLLRGED